MQLFSPTPPPTSEAELLTRARGLAGRSLAELSERVMRTCPPDQRRHKGYVGELMEELLGATASSLPQPDFEGIGVELKTIPVDHRGRPRESTYVCLVQLKDLEGETWETCWVRRKLSRVLWMPVDARPEVPLPERRVGSPLLWSPSPEEDAVLRADWEEHTERIRLGMIDMIEGRDGEVLQIRPKGANAKARVTGVGDTGAQVETLPRGYYLRAGFTAEILRRHYALPAGS
jgi:DNA mismatch repair protein MutH